MRASLPLFLCFSGCFGGGGRLRVTVDADPPISNIEKLRYFVSVGNDFPEEFGSSPSDPRMTPIEAGLPIRKERLGDFVLGVEALDLSGRLLGSGTAFGHLGPNQLLEVNVSLTSVAFAAAPGQGSIGNWTDSIGLGDFNGDGKTDLAMASRDTLNVLLNRGNGTFGAAVTYPAHDFSSSLAVGDLNGDGKADLVATNLGGDDVSVLLNKGDGKLAPAVDYATGSEPRAVVLGDLNGDGRADLVVLNGGSYDVSVLLNRGGGRFGAAVNHPVAAKVEDFFGFPYSAALGDLSGDGHVDVAVVNGAARKLDLLLNRGMGTFAPVISKDTHDSLFSVAIGELVGNGAPDLAAASSVDNMVFVFEYGDGTYGSGSHHPVGNQPEMVALGDLNGDGRADIVTPNLASNDVSVLLNIGNHEFTPQVRHATGRQPYAVALGDLNGDGKTDMVVATAKDGCNVLLNTSR